MYFILLLNTQLFNNLVFCNSATLPVVLIHGIASSSSQLDSVKTYLENKGLNVYVPNIGNGYSDSIFKPMNYQLNLLCEDLNSNIMFINGLNIIGMSQGGLLARGYVQICAKNVVHNLITWVSPHGGVFDKGQLNNAYTTNTQNTLSFSNYWRDPIDYENYLNYSTYLNTLNNEQYSHMYESNIINLHNLKNIVLVWSPNDDVLTPPESGKFSTYDKYLNVIDMKEAPYYKKLLLDTLINKIHIYETNCTHKAHKEPECFYYLEKYTLPYLL